MNIKEYEKFKIEKGIFDKDLAKLLKVSKPTYSKKKKGSLTIKDINVLIEEFNLTREDVIRIFIPNSSF